MPNRKKPLVVVTRKLPDSIETRMRELVRRRAQSRRHADDARPTSRPRCKTADVLVPTVTDRIDAAVLEPGRRPAQADRQFRQRRRQYRRRHRAAARHHRHQYAGRAHRRHRRHDDGADSRGAAPPVEGAAVLTGDETWTGWSPTWMLGHRIWRQAARHHRHGPHRPGGGAARARLRPADPLSQSPPGRAADRGGTRRDLLGEPRPDAGPHGHRLGQLPAHAGDLSSAVGAAAEADAAGRLSSSTPRAAR